MRPQNGAGVNTPRAGATFARFDAWRRTAAVAPFSADFCGIGRRPAAARGGAVFNALVINVITHACNETLRNLAK